MNNGTRDEKCKLSFACDVIDDVSDCLDFYVCRRDVVPNVVALAPWTLARGLLSSPIIFHSCTPSIGIINQRCSPSVVTYDLPFPTKSYMPPPLQCTSRTSPSLVLLPPPHSLPQHQRQHTAGPKPSSSF